MTAEPAPGFAHDALLCATDEELVAGMVPFLLDGLDGGEPVLLTCTDRTAQLLPEEIAAHRRLHVVPQQDLYHRAATAITTLQAFLDDMLAARAGSVRLVGEVDFGDQPSDWEAWADYEAALNLLFAAYPAWHLCVYDTRRLPADVVEVGELTHPHLRVGTTRFPNPRFIAPAEYLRRHARDQRDPLEDTPPTVDLDHLEHPAALAAARRAVRDAVDDVATKGTTAEDFTLAVNEIVSNAVQHGYPPARLRLWTTPRRFLCVVTDAGPGIDDPLAGYRPAHGSDLSRGGMGLWLVRQLCDQVQLSTTPAGFTARLATRQRGPAARSTSRRTAS